MLKLSTCGFISVVLLASTAVASAAPLMTKTISPGFVMQESALYTTCTIDDQGTVAIGTQLNGLSSKKIVHEQLSVDSIKKAISDASLGVIKVPEAQVADTSLTTYYAYQPYNGDFKKILLWEDTGIAAANTYNESSAALTLRNFMDAICK
jgi:hypothetical protein